MEAYLVFLPNLLLPTRQRDRQAARWGDGADRIALCPAWVWNNQKPFMITSWQRVKTWEGLNLRDLSRGRNSCSFNGKPCKVECARCARWQRWRPGCQVLGVGREREGLLAVLWGFFFQGLARSCRKSICKTNGAPFWEAEPEQFNQLHETVSLLLFFFFLSLKNSKSNPEIRLAVSVRNGVCMREVRVSPVPGLLLP